MIKILQIIILVFFSLLMMSASCDKGSEGCTDSSLCDYNGDGVFDEDENCACNYDETAAIDDNSCWYKSPGCDCEDPPGSVIDCLSICDADILNDPPDLDGDGNCDEGVIGGCIDSLICNYNINATHNNDSCAVDLSVFGGLSDGIDCNEECGGAAVIDGCDLCVGGLTNLGQSWRIEITAVATFKLEDGIFVGKNSNSIILGTSIYASDGYNRLELNDIDQIP